MSMRNAALVAATVGIVFGPTPALVEGVLVLDSVEFPNGVKEELVHDEGHYDSRMTATISAGSASIEYYGREGSGHYDLKGSVTFQEPPERIELGPDGAVIRLRASATFSGASNCCYLGLSFSYSAVHAYGRQFSDRSIDVGNYSPEHVSVGKRPLPSGRESEFWEGTATREIAAELSVPPGAGTGFAIAAIGPRGSLQALYTYRLEEEPEEEVAALPAPTIAPLPADLAVCALPMPGDVDTLSVTPMPGGVEPIDIHAIRDVPPDVIAVWIDDYMERNPQARGSQLRAIMELLDIDEPAAREIMREQLMLFSSRRAQAAIWRQDVAMAGVITSLEVARMAGIAASAVLAPALAVKATGTLIVKAAAWNAGRVAMQAGFRLLSKTAQRHMLNKARADAAAAVLGSYTIPAISAAGYKLWGAHYEAEGKRLGDPRLERLGKSFQETGGLLGKAAGIVKAPNDPTAWLEAAAELAKARVKALEDVCDNEDDPTLTTWRAIAAGLNNAAAASGFLDPAKLREIERANDPDKYHQYARHIADNFIEDLAKDGPGKLPDRLTEREIVALFDEFAETAQTLFDQAVALAEGSDDF